MEDPKILELISRHISGEETVLEKEVLSNWLSDNHRNTILFNKIKKLWEEGDERSLTLRQKFTRENITRVLIQQTLGNFIGFVVGIWVTHSFTHYVTEGRSLKNLFGLAGRKKILVNETPEWVQYGLSILLGFIALELINYFFQSKKHLLVWTYIKKSFNELQGNKN